jgi:hypothetical protein
VKGTKCPLVIHWPQLHDIWLVLSGIYLIS